MCPAPASTHQQKQELAARGSPRGLGVSAGSSSFLPLRPGLRWPRRHLVPRLRTWWGTSALAGAGQACAWGRHCLSSGRHEPRGPRVPGPAIASVVSTVAGLWEGGLPCLSDTHGFPELTLAGLTACDSSGDVVGDSRVSARSLRCLSHACRGAGSPWRAQRCLTLRGSSEHVAESESQFARRRGLSAACSSRSALSDGCQSAQGAAAGRRGRTSAERSPAARGPHRGQEKKLNNSPPILSPSVLCYQRG